MEWQRVEHGHSLGTQRRRLRAMGSEQETRLRVEPGEAGHSHGLSSSAPSDERRYRAEGTLGKQHQHEELWSGSGEIHSSDGGERIRFRARRSRRLRSGSAGRTERQLHRVVPRHEHHANVPGDALDGYLRVFAQEVQRVRRRSGIGLLVDKHS